VKGPASAAKFSLTAWSMICCAIAIVVVLFAHVSSAQSVPYERTFPQPKAIVEKRLKELQSASAGHLPSLEGFTVPGDRPLDHFRRGYYQCTAQVSATSSGGSTVRVNATITAWYSDPSLGKAAYQVLPSNGRLEADFLDQLQDVLGNQELSPSTAPRANPSASAPASAARSKAPTGSPFSLGNPLGLDHMSSLATQKAVIDRRVEEQEKELRGLEEILRNQAHPANLVAVRKKDTPVLANPIEDAKVLFLAAAEDEFEFLDANPNWVHVRISGISRGWIRRSGLEMPTADPDPAAAETESRSEPAHVETEPFHVGGEQVASFPGDWAPLLGKTVKIVTVQKAIDNATVTGPEAKLAFAKSLFDGQYADLIRTSSSVAGVVVIFDSDDGGMIAATMLALRQWKAGPLSDQALWRRCLFDPREAFGLVSNP
jgi:hypothetical protein